MTTTILSGNGILVDKSQEFKEQTINTLAITLSALSRGITSTTLTTPPTSPASESLYIVPSGASGTWSGQTNNIAQYYLGTLSFFTPFEGLIVWANDLKQWAYYSSGAWSYLANGTALWTLGTTQTATFTPVSGYKYPINTSSGAISITLPTTANGRYYFYDRGATTSTSGFATNSLTISPPSGYTIANLGSGNNLAINLAYGWVELWLNGTNFDLVGASR